MAARPPGEPPPGCMRPSPTTTRARETPTASGASRLAKALYGALRDRALSLPDDEETRAEFVTTRMVETGPGTVKNAARRP